ncbi:MAG: hypothetical protein M3463_06315 [Verrucomicrobiota bacterium]|nr:hypothetical protein [Verrucomicrobiota bacterium]
MPDLTVAFSFINIDYDQFYVRIEYLKGRASVTARVSTVNEDPLYNAEPTEIVLRETAVDSGVYESDRMILVSNTEDDLYGDALINQRTHKAALGSTVILEFDPAQGEEYQRFEVATVPIEKTIYVSPYILLEHEPGEPPSRVIDPAAVAADIRTIQETFAQAGIRVLSSPVIIDIDENDVPSFNIRDDGLDTNYDATRLTQEELSLFWYIETKYSRLPQEIFLIYTNYFDRRLSTGLAYMQRHAPNPSRNAGNIIIAANRTRLVAPHEVLHILLDAEHPPSEITFGYPNHYPFEFKHRRMLWSFPLDSSGFLSRKRMTKYTLGRQAERAKQNQRHTF